MSRVTTVMFDEVSSTTLLNRLIYEDFVLIVNRGRAEQIQNYYLHMNFYISKENYVGSTGNYAIRKSMDEKRKKLLIRL